MTAAFVNHIWHSTFFACVVAAIVVFFHRNRAQVRYWLWFGASVKFFVPFSLLISLGSYLQSEHYPTALSTTPVSVSMVQLAEPFPRTVSIAASGEQTSNWSTGIAAVFWATGFGVIALIRLRAWLRIRRTVRTSVPLDIAAPIEVRSSPSLLEPGVVGLWRPILLVPVGITDRLTPAQFEAVLAHELCHVRRRDNLFASIHMLVEAMFWFHPVVWWVGGRLVEERERACDEEVIKLGNAPQVYAEAIVKICRFYAESPLACVSGVTGSTIHKRIDSIMTNRVVTGLNLTRKAALALMGVAALGIPVIVGIVDSPRLRAAQAVATREKKFESVSITPCEIHPGSKRGGGHSITPGRMKTGCIALADENNLGLIQRAYVRFANGRPHPLGVLPIEGGPAWVRSDLYDIDARTSSNPTQEIMQGPMLQAVLEERFNLKVHVENREVPVYALTAAASGVSLKPFAEGSCVPMPMVVPFPQLAPGQRHCRVLAGVQPPRVNAEGATLADFSHLLSLVLDRPVVNKTGIRGKFDIYLEFAIEAATQKIVPGGDIARFASDPMAPSIFTAIQNLGLKLEATNGYREFLVIDHVDRPTEN
jgi:uncharacterized protein (TIGR03435 family)